MTDIWYKNPKVLLNNIDHFFPEKNQSNTEKNNALIRFAIYFGILILISKQDIKWLSISIIIIIITYFIGKTDYIKTTDKTCYKPTINNPFMNYTVADLINDPNRLAGCNYEDTIKDTLKSPLNEHEKNISVYQDVKTLTRQAFNTRVFSDSSDIWGKFVSDRNFYTMPSTTIVNDQIGFAKWCYGDSGDCKTTGNNCLKNRDPEYHRGRYSVIKK
jgi:hypothetical protein